MHAPEISCCFTGNRPEKLPWGGNERDLRCLLTQDQLYAALEDAYERGFRHFLCMYWLRRCMHWQLSIALEKALAQQK